MMKICEETPYRQRCTEARALKRAKRSLPSSPQMRIHIIESLAAEVLVGMMGLVKKFSKEKMLAVGHLEEKSSLRLSPV